MRFNDDRQELPELSVQITKPAAGTILSGPANGQPIAVVGTVGGNRVDESTLRLAVSAGGPAVAATVTTAPGSRETSWTANVLAVAPGPVLVTVQASARSKDRRPLNEEDVVSVEVPDTVQPHDLAVLQPTVGQTIVIAETGSEVAIEVRAQDYLGISSVVCGLDGAPPTILLARNPADATRWRGRVPVPALLLGNHTIDVRCTDQAGNSRSASVSIVTIDGTAPACQINSLQEGAKILWTGTGMRVSFTGTARDGQTGVNRVDWSLDRINWQAATTSDQWATWSAEVPIADYGFYTVAFRATDGAGTATIVVRTLEAISSYKPKDASELLSPRAYVDALLAFVRDHVQSAAGASIATSDVQAAFYQQFGALKEPLSDVGNQQVSTLRLAIEILRKHLTNQTKLISAHWRCDQTTGSIIADISGNSNHGSLTNGASFTTIRGRQAISFDGAAAYAEIPHALSLEVGKDDHDFSLTFWLFLRQGATNAWRALVHKGNTDTERSPAIWLNGSSNRLHYRISTTADPNEGGDSTSEIALNTWTHIAYVKRGNLLCLYLDGILDSTVTLQGQSISNTGPLYLGNDPFYDGTNCCLSDLRIYQLALSEASIQTLSSDLSASSYSVATEGEYRLLAFESLLRQLGTTFEELRLARSASPSTRQALAERLGFTLDATRPDQLDQLVPPANFGEAWLEQRFGLIDTSRITPGTPPTQSDVLTWRIQSLQRSWLVQDHPAQPGVAGLLIDPDLIDARDLANPVQGNTIYDLWLARRGWIENERTTLKQAREAQASAIAGFERVLALVYAADADLTVIEADQNAGIEIGPALQRRHLDPTTFTYLLRVRDLARQSSVTDLEWNDLYDILTQVRKAQEAAQWQVQEAQIALTPEHFSIERTSRVLPPWRATSAARRTWQERLAARIDQQAAMQQALFAALQQTEQQTLPVLRDSLIASLAGPDIAVQIGDFLADWLLIDVRASGEQRTTRIWQAIETLQLLIFALRTLRFDLAHPAAEWHLVDEGITTAEQEANVDEEWRAMGSYAAWRAMMLVFLYPENYLWPGLREPANRSEAFKTLLEALRAATKLTPERARELASNYMEAVRSASNLPSTLQLTDRMSTLDLYLLGQLPQEVWAAANDPVLIGEVFYFVPMQLGLQLTRFGEYRAALDWYQRVYAYQLPESGRKLSYWLRREQNGAPQLTRDAHWLRKATNPHMIAAARPNPYTRFSLMSIAACMLDYADIQFTQDTSESLSGARALYRSAADILNLPDLALLQPATVGQALLPNPAIDILRLRASTQLAKLRQGRNIAGMLRQVSLPASQQQSETGLIRTGTRNILPTPPPARLPTPYRFSFLIERSKQLTNIAQQIEANYLATMEKAAAEEYSFLKAGHDLKLMQAGKDLQDFRVKEAALGESLATLQRQRAEQQVSHYRQLLATPISKKEQEALDFQEAAHEKLWYVYWLNSAATYHQVVAAAAGGTNYVSAIAGGGAAGLQGAGQATQILASIQNSSAQLLNTRASLERKQQEWAFQESLAEADVSIGKAHEQISQAQSAVRQQEAAIANLQTQQAKVIVDFFTNKFLTTELYEWMSGVLGDVYRFFLQQATAVARLAESQLAFERQVIAPTLIQADYWEQAPANDTKASEQTKDRRGLTGSARLLRDIFQLDQYAVEADRRKLNLSQTFSLVSLAPFELQEFRRTGVLRFATPMGLFDSDFPGQYLRLIKRVRLSMVALIPPTRGIRATLTASGISRVVVGEESFGERVIRRDPETVAFTSPVNASGVFELDVQPEMLFPFEAMGVDTAWEFQAPLPANPFAFDSIMDILLTIDYTALYDGSYRQQVLQKLPRRTSGERSFSIRSNFPDTWYDLVNAENAQRSLIASFTFLRSDFPPHLTSVSLDHIVVYFVRKNGASFEVEVRDLSITHDDSTTKDSNMARGATSIDGVISTRRGNAPSWGFLADKQRSPVGVWELNLQNEDVVEERNLRARLKQGEIEDILLVITYAGTLASWPP